MLKLKWIQIQKRCGNTEEIKHKAHLASKIETVVKLVARPQLAKPDSELMNQMQHSSRGIQMHSSHIRTKRIQR
jgi:hypothetical protein